ncbi:poliovirus receptor homolog [Orycteropus afer afer]|uniref:Poliovirus receptor homolog n=1 Tax=Orycteropus afer afer TaxID=1230840 RepID=A0A8B7A013_ORYAF|nr:poliovirus receptor homolog [Orycteropus afer afer]
MARTGCSLLQARPRLFPDPAGAQEDLVDMPTQVEGYLGSNATLPCYLKSMKTMGVVLQVTWQRLEDPHSSVATFHHKGDTVFSEPGRMAFVAARPGEELRDGSLVLQGLRPYDEGYYTCEFVTFPGGTLKNGTWLHVLARPQNHVEALEVDVPLSPVPVPVARCTSTGGRPPARISWSLPLDWKASVDWKANTSQVPGPLPGTVSVTSLLTLVPSSQANNKNVTCQVQHESFKGPDLLPMALTVRCETVGPLPPSAVARGRQLLIHTVDESINTTLICYVMNTVGTGQAKLTVVVRDRPGVLSDGVKIIISVVIVAVVAVLGFICVTVYRSKCESPHWNIPVGLL